MAYWLKCFLSGIFVGFVLCMFVGYGLIKHDEKKEKNKNGRDN